MHSFCSGQHIQILDEILHPMVFRQIYLYVMANYISNEIVPIALSYPAGWFVCSAATLLYYTHCKFDHYRLVEDV